MGDGNSPIRNIERDYRIIYACTNPPATIHAGMTRKHLAEGVARRLIMIGDSLEVIDTIAAHGRTAVLSSEEAAALNLHLNSYYVHLRGTLDNLAWALHYEHRILGPADEDDIRTRRQCGLADQRFRDPLRRLLPDLDRVLSVHDRWLDDLRDFRDPVVHRIPLYAVPGVIERGSDEERQINAIHQEINAMIAAGANSEDVMQRMRDSYAIGTFKPVLARSGPSGVQTVDLRQQVLDDYERLAAITRAVLRQLTGVTV